MICNACKGNKGKSITWYDTGKTQWYDCRDCKGTGEVKDRLIDIDTEMRHDLKQLIDGDFVQVTPAMFKQLRVGDIVINRDFIIGSWKADLHASIVVQAPQFTPEGLFINGTMLVQQYTILERCGW